MRQILKQNFHNASDFDMKVLQPSEFVSLKNNALDFVSQFLRRVRFWRKINI